MEGTKFHPPELPTHPHLHFVSNTVHNTLINMFISNPLITHSFTCFFSFIFFSSEKNKHFMLESSQISMHNRQNIKSFVRNFFLKISCVAQI